ncbi:unnamed protein product [Durusdinium trenchii]|uniref:Uncharacterized protein n=1 Tax=Durusdinium trenchii TaxID=1381693 RepID=A0ABP0RIV9_9DINO
MALRGILFSLLHFDLVDLSLAEGAEAAESSTRFLRGRQLQTDSQRLVQAQCKPGYSDVTNGQAYYWSCAHYCEGGKYYATKGCICACLTPKQEEVWLASGGVAGSADGEADGSTDVGRILVTPLPRTTTVQDRGPVQPIPIGELNGGEWHGSPSVVEGPILPSRWATTSGAPDVESEDTGLDLMLLSLLGAGCIVAVAVLGLVCFNWRTLLGSCTKKKRESPKVFAQSPVLQLHLPKDLCPQPVINLDLSSRRSSKTSEGAIATTGPAAVAPSSRRSSKASGVSVAVASARPERNLLKPPPARDYIPSDVSTCSGVSSAESLQSWAHRVEKPHSGSSGRQLTPEPKGSRSSSRRSSRSSRKISKVKPLEGQTSASH